VSTISIRSTLKSDVVIVGGGPAGAATANRLASSGFKVLLIDQQTFPRDKVCGDFLSPVALVELKKIGITDLPEFRKGNIVYDVMLYLNGKGLIVRSIPWVEGYPQYSRIIPRLTLDNLLLNSARNAGATVLEGYRLIDYKIQNNAVDLMVEGPSGPECFSTSLLIAADGSNSVVAQKLRGPPPKGNRIIGVRGYFEDVEGPQDQADLYFSDSSFPDYCWLFPLGKGKANVGVGVLLDALPQNDNPAELLNNLLKNDVALNRRLKNARLVGEVAGWPLTTYNPKLPVVGERVILVGDAAGLVNPINGEGIQNALLSAGWASEIASSCILTGDFSRSKLSAYSESVEKGLRFETSLSNLIIQLIKNRNLNPVWLKALRIIVARAKVDPSYSDVVGGILAGLVPSSKALDYKIITGTIEQAVISLSTDALLSTLKGPKSMMQVGTETVQIGIEMIRNNAEHAPEMAGWAINSAFRILEISLQFSKKAIDPIQTSVPALAGIKIKSLAQPCISQSEE
jgi:menaquinone-9 beta-reductase